MTRWPEAADEIVVRDGHLTINLYKLSDGWSARIESAYEGRVFEGRVTEMSDLLAGTRPGRRRCGAGRRRAYLGWRRKRRRGGAGRRRASLS